MKKLKVPKKFVFMVVFTLLFCILTERINKDSISYCTYEIFLGNEDETITGNLMYKNNFDSSLQQYELVWEKQTNFTNEFVDGGGVVYGFQNKEQPNLWIIVMKSEISVGEETRDDKTVLKQIKWELSKEGGTFYRWTPTSNYNSNQNDFYIYLDQCNDLGEDLPIDGYFRLPHKGNSVESYILESQYSLILTLDCKILEQDIYTTEAILYINTKTADSIKLNWNWALVVS